MFLSTLEKQTGKKGSHGHTCTWQYETKFSILALLALSNDIINCTHSFCGIINNDTHQVGFTNQSIVQVIVYNNVKCNFLSLCSNTHGTRWWLIRIILFNSLSIQGINISVLPATDKLALTVYVSASDEPFGWFKTLFICNYLFCRYEWELSSCFSLYLFIFMKWNSRNLLFSTSNKTKTTSAILTKPTLETFRSQYRIRGKIEQLETHELVRLPE